jgi:hypothetical protein
MTQRDGIEGCRKIAIIDVCYRTEPCVEPLLLACHYGGRIGIEPRRKPTHRPRTLEKLAVPSANIKHTTSVVTDEEQVTAMVIKLQA